MNDSIWTDNEETNDQAFLHSESAIRSEQLAEDPPLEKEIAQVVMYMLGVSSIDVDKSLFEAGADSLTVARLSAYLSDRYQIDVPLHEMFKEPTVQGLACMVNYFSSISHTPSADGWSWKAEHLEAEAALDSSITPDELPEARYLQPATVFLTGATGYVGAFLLDVLLHRTDATIYCLVRAKDSESGLRRIQQNLQYLRAWNEDYRQRIRPVCGDLGLPWLGLSSETFALLAQNVDAIYHCGGQVNLSYPYDTLKKINVMGTQEILRLACHTRRKAVHYLSNADVHRKARMPRPFLEADLPRQPRAIPDGYMRAKWVSEQMLTTARDRGLPITIHRPGFLIGHSQTGVCSTTNYLLLALKGFLQLGVFPQLSEIFNVAPVDCVAEAIVYLAGKENSYGKHYHHWDLKPMPMETIYSWLHSFGYDFEVVPYNVALRRALQVELDHSLYRVLPLFNIYSEAEGYRESFMSPIVQENISLETECANTLNGLQGSGITYPPVTEEMFHRFLAYLVEIEYLPTPSRSPFNTGSTQKQL